MLLICDSTEAGMRSLSANAERFLQWRTIDGIQLDPLGQFNELQTLVRGALAPQVLLDYVLPTGPSTTQPSRPAAR